MEQVVSSITANKCIVQQWSLACQEVDYEVAGDIVLDPFKVNPISRGTTREVASMTNYSPLLHHRIGWHSHPEIVIPGNEAFETNPIFVVPSGVDMMNMIEASLFYSKEEIHQAIGAIFGKEGVFLYGPSLSFLHYLRTQKEDLLRIVDIVDKITMWAKMDSKKTDSENAFTFIENVQSYSKSKYPDEENSDKIDELFPSAFELVYIPFEDKVALIKSLPLRGGTRRPKKHSRKSHLLVNVGSTVHRRRTRVDPFVRR